MTYPTPVVDDAGKLGVWLVRASEITWVDYTMVELLVYVSDVWLKTNLERSKWS